MSPNNERHEEGKEPEEEPPVGWSQTTTEPMQLDVSVTVDDFQRAAKLTLRGQEDRPAGGVSAAAYLSADTARTIGKELIAAADELEGDDG
jgi:hypothetical protein